MRNLIVAALLVVLPAVQIGCSDIVVVRDGEWVVEEEVIVEEVWHDAAWGWLLPFGDYYYDDQYWVEDDGGYYDEYEDAWVEEEWVADDQYEDDWYEDVWIDDDWSWNDWSDDGWADESWDDGEEYWF